MKLYHSLIFFLIFFIPHLYSECNIELKISGTPYFTEKILNDAVTSQDCTSAEEVLDKLLDFYVEKSFPFVSVKLDSVIQDGQKEIFYLTINSGDYVLINEIAFNGAKITKKKVLTRQSRVKTGERFDERSVEEGRLWLYKSGLFNKRPDTDFYSHDNIYGIKYILSEKKYNELMLLGGYSSDDEKDNLSVTAEIRMDNIFGTMRKASILWDRYSDDYENLKIGYFEPFFFSANVSTELKYSQKYRKHLSLTRYYSAMQSYGFDPSSSLNYGLSGQTVYPDSLYAGSVKTIITNKYSAGLKYSTIYNWQTIPQDTGFETEIMLSSVEIDIEDSVSISGAEIYAVTDYIFSPYKKIFTNISVLYNHIAFKDDIPDFSRIYFGGASSLRGYREDFLQSDIFIKGSLDLFFVAGSGDLAFRTFYDGAYFNPEQRNLHKLSELSFISGAGGGIIFEGKSGYIEITAGIPLDQDISDSVLHAKYSVRF